MVFILYSRWTARQLFIHIHYYVLCIMFEHCYYSENTFVTDAQFISGNLDHMQRGPCIC